MCGIFLIVTDQPNPLPKRILQNETIQYYLSRRGPDHFEKYVLDYPCNEEKTIRLTFLSSVLQLRGYFVCDQPVKSTNGSVLQWNGQIFGGFYLKPEQSDTEQLMSALESAEREENTLAILATVKGPWAFTYWDNIHKRLWIGRDVLGRRSLCWNTNRDQMLIISSVAHIFNPDKQHPSVAHTAESNLLKRLEFEEIPTLGVFCYDFAAYSNLSDVLKNVRVFHWNRSISGASLSLDRLFLSSTIESPITVKLNMTIPDEQLRFKLSQVDICQSFIPDSVVESFEKSLLQAVKVRCENHQNVCRKCFSRYVKHNEKKRSLTENGIDLNFYSSDSEDEMRHGMSMVNGITFRECTHASVAILFSGGIDSTIIALMADQFVPENIPIDLLNVAFCNDAPDRETGLAAWAELRSISPKRKWNFVSIHISKEELESYRTKHIKYLVKPLQTYLDDSIGCAVWFATRGKGLLLQEQGSILSAYQTRARVVLLGMGADEQLGGYLRYRKAFAAEGYVGLLEQIAQDLDRISSRNLGRDDRVTADHGIEARFPFLDEDVVGFLNSLPIWQKCNLSLERGKGEKLLLRMLADRMGLNRVVYHEKRAIQFGSRIAKLEFPKVKADMICSKLVE